MRPDRGRGEGQDVWAVAEFARVSGLVFGGHGGDEDADGDAAGEDSCGDQRSEGEVGGLVAGLPAASAAVVVDDDRGGAAVFGFRFPRHCGKVPPCVCLAARSCLGT